MPDTELAEELLQIEEADAWFEYLESTRGQNETPLPGARAVGLGAPHASACVPSARAAPGCGPRRPERAGCLAAVAEPLIALRQAYGHAFHTRRSARRSARRSCARAR